MPPKMRMYGTKGDALFQVISNYPKRDIFDGIDIYHFALVKADHMNTLFEKYGQKNFDNIDELEKLY